MLDRRAWWVDEAAAWEQVTGLTVGKDFSERITGTAGPSRQFSLGKSLPGFGPTGPWLVTIEEFTDPDDLELGCAIDGETAQKGRTRGLIFSVPAMSATLSRKLPPLPGDVLFTGTPSRSAWAGHRSASSSPARSSCPPSRASASSGSASTPPRPPEHPVHATRSTDGSAPPHPDRYGPFPTLS